jgi:hypothetical protein
LNVFRAAFGVWVNAGRGGCSPLIGEATIGAELVAADGGICTELKSKKILKIF